MLPFLPSFTQPSSLLLYNNVDAFFFYIVRNYFLLTSTPLRILWKGTEFLCNVVCIEIAAPASFFAFLDFYTLSLIFSLLRSIYPFSGCNKQKGFLLPKNHLYYIIARCPLSLLIPYRGFEIYFAQGISRLYSVYFTRHSIQFEMKFHF